MQLYFRPRPLFSLSISWSLGLAAHNNKTRNTRTHTYSYLCSFAPAELNEAVEVISSRYIMAMADCLDKAFDEFNNVDTVDLL